LERSQVCKRDRHLLQSDDTMRIPTRNSLDIPVVGFERIAGLSGAPAGAARPAALAAACDAAGDFSVELATQHATEPAFCGVWRALVLAGDSPQKIYQTPEFFQFQRETVNDGERLELLGVRRRSDGVLVGVVPVRLGRQQVVFGVGKLVLYRHTVATINVLGSIPAMPSCPALAQYVVLRMLQLFPFASAVFMQSLPLRSAHWHHVAATPAFGAALLGPWRECHTQPLPATFEQYMGQFSAKKRYNLNRQIRQLEAQAGALDVRRIAQPEQVAGMMASLGALLPPARLASVLQQATFEALARKSLLLCYVLRAGDEVLAAVVGTRSPDVWHIHNIFVSKHHTSLSVGTTALHLALQDLMGEGCFRLVDFGYGTPNHAFRSSHVLETRAQVLLFDRARPVRLLLRAHGWFSALAEGAVARIKALLALRRTRRPA
jgi:hypothetical protein